MWCAFERGFHKADDVLCRRVACCSLLFLSLFIGAVKGQEANSASDYQRVIQERAQKIVDRLGIVNAEQSVRIRDRIAQFYGDLHTVHEERDEALKRLKDGPGSEREAVLSNTETKQFRLHYGFLAALATELSGAQIDQVKDGLTYDVVNVTMKQYRKLYPTLTDEQQRRVHMMLLEAREFAMDAGSSKEKHAWFGKYKGRINNYLSAEGYDAKQAERDLKAREEKK